MALEKPNMELELSLDSSSECEVSLSDFDSLEELKLNSFNRVDTEGDLFKSDDEREQILELNTFTALIQKYIPMVKNWGPKNDRTSKLMLKLMDFSPVERKQLYYMLTGSEIEDDNSDNIEEGKFEIEAKEKEIEILYEDIKNERSKAENELKIFLRRIQVMIIKKMKNKPPNEVFKELNSVLHEHLNKAEDERRKMIIFLILKEMDARSEEQTKNIISEIKEAGDGDQLSISDRTILEIKRVCSNIDNIDVRKFLSEWEIDKQMLMKTGNVLQTRIRSNSLISESPEKEEMRKANAVVIPNKIKKIFVEDLEELPPSQTKSSKVLKKDNSSSNLLAQTASTATTLQSQNLKKYSNRYEEKKRRIKRSSVSITEESGKLSSIPESQGKDPKSIYFPNETNSEEFFDESSVYSLKRQRERSAKEEGIIFIDQENNDEEEDEALTNSDKRRLRKKFKKYSSSQKHQTQEKSDLSINRSEVVTSFLKEPEIFSDFKGDHTSIKKMAHQNEKSSERKNLEIIIEKPIGNSEKPAQGTKSKIDLELDGVDENDMEILPLQEEEEDIMFIEKHVFIASKKRTKSSKKYLKSTKKTKNTKKAKVPTPPIEESSETDEPLKLDSEIVENITSIDLCELVQKEKDLTIKSENKIDDDTLKNWFFVEKNIFNKTDQYFKEPEALIKQGQLETCDCKDFCRSDCKCIKFNKEMGLVGNPYKFDPKSKIKFLNPKILESTHIFECSKYCKCNKRLCSNSLLSTEEFSITNNKNFTVKRYAKGNKSKKEHMWGLMSRIDIPENTFVIEYTGEIITKKEADHRGLYYDKLYSNYLFDLNTHVAHKTGNRFLVDHHEIELKEFGKDDLLRDFPLCIDAFYYGNLSRFINHSCEPNLKAINIHVENRNVLLGRVAFFSTRPISKKEELTIDYHCLPLDKNGDEESELKCLCGSEKCKGFVYKNVKKKDKLIRKGNPLYDPIYI